MLKDLILSDFRRYGISRASIYQILRIFFFQPVPGLKFLFVFRVVQYYRRRNRFIFLFSYFIYLKLKFKYGIDISYRATIGRGLYIGHFGGIVVHGDAVIGNNCNISQGVTIGVINHGSKRGLPIIGDNVFVGPNSCVFGKVIIGDCVTIGANCVVTDSITKNHTIITPRSICIERDLSAYYIKNRV